MRAILRTYVKEKRYFDVWCEVADNHYFPDGPYQDTVGFAVGSNQTIVPVSAARNTPYEVLKRAGGWIITRGESYNEEDEVWWSAHLAAEYLAENARTIVNLLAVAGNKLAEMRPDIERALDHPELKKWLTEPDI